MQKGGPENPELLTPFAILGADRNNYRFIIDNDGVSYLPPGYSNPISLSVDIYAYRPYKELPTLSARIDFTRADHTPQRWMLKQTPSDLTIYASVLPSEMPQSILLPEYPFNHLRFLTTAVLTLKQRQPESPAGIYQDDIDYEKSRVTETLFFRAPSDAVMTLTHLLQAMRVAKPNGHPFGSLPQASA